MPPENDDTIQEVSEPVESKSKDVAEDLSRSSQEKPQDLADKERAQSELRKMGMTASSFDLPKVDLSVGDDGKLVAKIADKAYTVDAKEAATGDRSLAPADASQERSAQPDDSGEMGKAGDRSRDSGLGKPTRSEVQTDDQGRVTGYKMPDGTKYDIKYGEDGKSAEPTSVTITPEKSAPMTFEKGKNGWRTPDGKMELDYLSFDKDSKKITIRGGGNDMTINPDGSYEEKDWRAGKVTQKVDADGTAHVYDNSKGTETVTKPDSSVSETKDISSGKVTGYELRDDQGHVTRVDVNDDGSATVTRGDKTVKYDKVEREANGDVKLTNNKDKTSVEMKQDGTEIERKGDHITKITNSDGEVTEFKRSGDKVTGVTVTDAQGRVVETRKSGIEIDDKTGNYTVKLDKKEAEARKADGESGTADRLERKADGTERLLDKDGKEVKSDADKLLEKFHNYTPEQQRQLRQDLADIDKLPPEKREAVYKSLDKIARNDEHPDDKIRLTGQQARELVQSLAHQVAHPESIQQGDKMTCALANSEQTLARNNPEVYADMVAKLATEGKYTTQDGKTIEAQTGSDGKSLAPKTDFYGQRSYTSELFQNGVANLGLPEGAKYESLPPGDPRLLPRPAGVDASTDTGERVRYPDGRVTKFEGLTAKEQGDVLNHLVKDGKYGPQSINSPQDLENALKKNGGPPLNVGIALGGGDQAQTGMGSGEGAAMSGYHAVNVTHFDKGPPAMVYYENPAGGTDHSYPNGKGVPADDFIKAMHAGKTEMKAVVKGAEGAGDKPAGKMGNPNDASAPAGDAKMGNPITLDPVTIVGDPTAPDVPGADYRGEGIKREIFPDEQPLKEGEKFEDLAKRQFGPEPPPTQAEVDAYVKEIKQLNNVAEESQVRPDQRLKLPGHNANGDLILDDGKATRTVTPDGKVKVEHYDGTRYEMTPLPNGGHEYHHRGHKPGETYDYSYQPDGKGGFTEKHTGARPEDNYEITKTPDGHYKIKDAKGEKDVDKYDEANPDPRVERAKMLEAINNSPMTDEARARMYEDMERFEDRARKQNLDPKEQARFYHEVGRLVDAKDSGNKDLPDTFERMKLAEKVMHNAADPKSIDQGMHGSCGAAALETRIYTQNPSAAAKMVTDVATTGEFKSKDGQTVRPDPSLLKPDAEGQIDPTPDGKRNYASQVFQGTAISMEPSGAGYKQGQPDESARPPKTGETCNAGEFKGVSPAEVQDMEKRITGNDKAPPVIENSKVNVGDGQVHVGSEQEMRAQLTKMKNAHPPQLPAVVFVHSQNEPFFADSGGGKAGGSGAGHFVTVTDFDPNTGKVSIDNQWGKGSDHKDVSVGQLYRATEHSKEDRIKELEADVKRNKALHKEDPVAELELLRLQKDAGVIDSDNYDKQVIQLMQDNIGRWKNDPDLKSISADQRRQLKRSYDAMLYSLPESERAKVRSKVGDVPEAVDNTTIIAQ